MDFDLPLWTISPALMLLTLLYFIPSHMNYSVNEWLLGNGIVLVGVGLVYLGRSTYNKLRGQDIID
jgi:hypothetical protein|tara:strand:- start:23 stop:220 length:198 start_codon:yes stop_codon:yes gene_type:complete